jgi:hypothetical protein
MEISKEFTGHPDGQRVVVRSRGDFVTSFATETEADAFVSRVEALRDRAGLLATEAIEAVLHHPSTRGAPHEDHEDPI